MKYLLFIFSLLFTSLIWSKDVDYNDLVKRDGLYYEKFTDKPFTGLSSGLEQGKIRKGLRNGTWIKYYKKGQLYVKGSHKDGKKYGEFLRYYKNGQLYAKIHYKNDKLDGEYLLYWNNGQLEIKSNHKDGKKYGEFLRYYKNGQLLQKNITKTINVTVNNYSIIRTVG